jgi:hypothetical protein
VSGSGAWGEPRRRCRRERPAPRGRLVAEVGAAAATGGAAGVGLLVWSAAQCGRVVMMTSAYPG